MTEQGALSRPRETCDRGLYRAEVTHRRGPWRSFEAVDFATLERVDWLNNRRLLEPIGNIPPPKAEAAYHAMLAKQPLAAKPEPSGLRQTRGSSRCMFRLARFYSFPYSESGDNSGLERRTWMKVDTATRVALAPPFIASDPADGVQKSAMYILRFVFTTTNN